MDPVNVLVSTVWLLLMMVAQNEAQLQTVKLMTRSSDAAALCALDDPTLNAEMSSEMPGAPEVVRCAMTCTSYGGCKHFNYVSTESKPCQLYNYRPTDFDVSPNCQHYYQPGQHKCDFLICKATIKFLDYYHEIEWSRDWWRHMILKFKVATPILCKAWYLENSSR